MRDSLFSLTTTGEGVSALAEALGLVVENGWPNHEYPRTVFGWSTVPAASFEDAGGWPRSRSVAVGFHFHQPHRGTFVPFPAPVSDMMFVANMAVDWLAQLDPSERGPQPHVEGSVTSGWELRFDPLHSFGTPPVLVMPHWQVFGK